MHSAKGISITTLLMALENAMKKQNTYRFVRLT